jgi:hypothetical protein
MRARATAERLARGASDENLRDARGKRAKLGPARQCGRGRSVSFARQKESVP